MDNTSRSLIESAPDALVIVDIDGNIAIVNSQMERLFGYQREEVIGRPVEILIPERYRELHSGHRHRYAQAPRFRPMGAGRELNGLRKDGSEFPVEISLSPLATEDGTFVISAIRNITQRKQAEAVIAKLNGYLYEAVARSEKLATAGRMMAIVAHEVNNALESLTSGLYLLKKSPGLDESGKELVAAAEEQVGRISEICRQTLEPHHATKEPVPVRIAELLDDICSVLKRRIDAARIQVIRYYHSETTVLAYPTELRQIFTNLITNAIDAMPNGGHLQLSFLSDEKHAHVTVSDTGCGIPSEHIDRIFDQFFTTKGEQGTGVGLWLTKSLITKLGGTLKLSSSTKPGLTGTSFGVILPVGDTPT